MQTNYSSEYIKDLMGSEEEDLSICRANVAHIKEAIKFRLPEGGVLLDLITEDAITTEMLKQKIPSVIEHMKLPYDKVVLEYPLVNPKDNKRTSIMILASNTDKDIFFRVISRSHKNGENHWTDFKAEVLFDTDFNLKHRHFDGKHILMNKHMGVAVFHCAYIILCFIAALQCSNVIEQNVPAPAKLNKSRIKKGNPPLFDYKVLTVDTKAAKATSKAQASNNEPSHTKREHLRRGHIRRYESKTIWVNPCVIGDKNKGSLKKSYQVK